MKTLISIILPLLFSVNANSKMFGNGENNPTVQSAFEGTCYVRSVPTEDFGTQGKTRVYKVKSDNDQLLDEYSLYMRGSLYLGWTPLAGKWCLVHVEPARVTSDTDYRNMGKITRLAFYMGGKELYSYTSEDLQKIGLERKVAHLQNRIPGSFIVHGIEQIPCTNYYVFSVEVTNKSGNPEKVTFDITTGKLYQKNTKEKE